MFPKGPTGLVYGLNHKSRALDAQHKSGKSRFLIGTNSLIEQNQIHHVEVNEDFSGVKRIAIYDHPSELWAISCSPHDSDLFLTVGHHAQKYSVVLWRISSNKKISEETTLGEYDSLVKSLLWDGENNNQCITLHSDNLRLWDLNKSEELLNLKISNTKPLSAASWNPYFTEQVIVTSGPGINLCDLRSKSSTAVVENAHDQLVRDIDINPNNPYNFVTGGDDGVIKFWDTRKLITPVLDFTNHQHWIQCVKYNSFKDSLVLSAGTDGIVNLWGIHSLAFKNPSEQQKQQLDDSLLNSYADHEDSIYSIAWSSNPANPWLFASVSYDGRVIVNRIPEEVIQRVTN